MTPLPASIRRAAEVADAYARVVVWHVEHSAESSADPKAVWRRYLDVEHWCEWSRHGVEWSRIDGPFEVGTEGKSKPPGPALSDFVS